LQVLGNLFELFSKKNFSLKIERLTFAGAIFKPFFYLLFLFKTKSVGVPFFRFDFFERISRRQIGKISGTWLLFVEFLNCQLPTEKGSMA